MEKAQMVKNARIEAVLTKNGRFFDNIYIGKVKDGVAPPAIERSPLSQGGVRQCREGVCAEEL